MTEQPAGWYPDPFAAVPDASRYWDGERWTSHAQAPTLEPQPLESQVVDPHGPGQQRRSWSSAQPPVGHPEAEPRQQDELAGAPALASWGRRVAAYLIDAIPMVILTMVMLQVLGIADAMSAAIAAEDVAAIDAANAMLAATSTTGITITVVNLLFSALYNIGFHVSRGATPGKMLVGIRVRQVAQDRNPELRGAGLRWLVQFGPSVLNGVQLIGAISSIFNIADHLWPIWDSQNQAFHDKAGSTLVVRSR